MANVCVIRHQSYIKSEAHRPYRHNMRALKNYSNDNIDLSYTKLNSIIENNLNQGETYLKAFNRLYKSGAFTGQLKVQGDEKKQTKYLDEFLVYPPYEKIKEMSLAEQDEFFRKEMKAIQNYFPDVIILSAVVHRDEVFLPVDEEMKSLFPEGKITPHMHLAVIPIIYDKKANSKKISISELWKGKNSYRKFQDFMYDSIGKEYGFDRGEIHDFSEATKHLSVEAFKLQEASKTLNKLQYQIIQKEQELAEQAKDLEPDKSVNLFNLKKKMEMQSALQYALNQEKDKNTHLQKEKEELISALQENDNVILNQNKELKIQQQKLSETEKQLSDEMERTNEFLNIKVSHEGVRADAITRTKTKIRLFDLLFKTVINHLPDLFHRCPKFIRDLVNIGILSDKDLPDAQSKEERLNR